MFFFFTLIIHRSFHLLFNDTGHQINGCCTEHLLLCARWSEIATLWSQFSFSILIQISVFFLLMIWLNSSQTRKLIYDDKQQTAQTSKHKLNSRQSHSISQKEKKNKQMSPPPTSQLTICVFWFKFESWPLYWRNHQESRVLWGRTN